MKQIVQGLWEIDEIGDGPRSYIWEWEAGLTLIDTSYAKDADTIVRSLVAHGHPIHDVRRIIVTHASPGHAGGLARLQQTTRAQIVCHAVERDLLVHPVRHRPGPLWKSVPGALATLANPQRGLPSVTPDVLIVDGQRLPEGFTAIHTPGVSPGHIALLHPARRILIAGAALTNRGGKLRPAGGMGIPDPVNAEKSIWKLAKRYADEIDVIVFGQGEPILTNGGKRIKALASQIFETAI